MIEAYGSSLGVTETGKAWCIKALHPSDPLTEVRGVPDESTQATVFLNMQEEVQITAPASAAWDADLNVIPDPSCPLTWYTLAGGTSGTGAQHNTIGGSTSVQAAADNWLNLCQRWRMAYMGVSCYLTANSLTNEGAVTAAQYSFKGRRLSSTYGDGGEETSIRVNKLGLMLVTPFDNPEYATLVKMPNVYTGAAADGCYMPIKLDSNHQAWHDEDDMCYSIPYATGDTFALTTTAGTPIHPYWTSNCASFDTVNKVIIGGHHLAPCAQALGKIDFRGLNPAAKITVVIRYGYEVQVFPESQYSAFQALPPEFDLQAVNAYFKIARQLKDAYPVEYNDLGKLWDVIKSVAKTVDPFLSMVPGGDVIRMVGRGVGAIGDAVQRRGASNAAPPDQPSQAAIEAAKASVKSKLSKKQVKAARKKVATRRR